MKNKKLTEEVIVNLGATAHGRDGSKTRRKSWKVKTRSYACAQFTCKISKARMERAESKG